MLFKSVNRSYTPTCYHVRFYLFFTPQCICKCMSLSGPIVPEIKTTVFYSSVFYSIHVHCLLTVEALAHWQVHPRQHNTDIMHGVKQHTGEIYLYLYRRVCVCLCILLGVYTSPPVVRSGPNSAHAWRFI